MNQSTNAPKGMRTFFIIWAGQLISIIGSGLTGFGLSVWIYTQTGEATPFALNAFFYIGLIMMPSPVGRSFG